MLICSGHLCCTLFISSQAMIASSQNMKNNIRFVLIYLASLTVKFYTELIKIINLLNQIAIVRHLICKAGLVLF